MTDINARIAKAKGWTQYITYDEDGISEDWYTPNNKHSIFGRIPKYTTDWRLAGELLEEMATNNDGKEEGYNEVIIWKNRGNNKWYCELSCFMKPFEADTPQMAICLAWLEWSEK